MSTPYDIDTQLKRNKNDLMTQSEYARIIESLIHLIKYLRGIMNYGIPYTGFSFHFIR